MESTTKTVLMLIVRRAVSALGVFLVAHAMLASGPDQNAFVEIFSGIAVSGAELGLEWWRKTGMVLISTKLAKLKGIPLPQDGGVVTTVPTNTGVKQVEVTSKAA